MMIFKCSLAPLLNHFQSNQFLTPFLFNKPGFLHTARTWLHKGDFQTRIDTNRRVLFNCWSLSRYMQDTIYSMCDEIMAKWASEMKCGLKVIKSWRLLLKLFSAFTLFSSSLPINIYPSATGETRCDLGRSLCLYIVKTYSVWNDSRTTLFDSRLNEPVAVYRCCRLWPLFKM